MFDMSRLVIMLNMVAIVVTFIDEHNLLLLIQNGPTAFLMYLYDPLIYCRVKDQRFQKISKNRNKINYPDSIAPVFNLL